MNEKDGEKDNGHFLSPQRRPDISTLSLAARRQLSNGNGSGMRVSSGIAIPSHMRHHGQEGFRTPTGEDYEQYTWNEAKNKNRSDPKLSNGTANGHSRNSNGQSISGLERLRVQIDPPPGSANGTPRASINRSRLSLSAMTEKIDHTLKWKVRIRHYTWTFFTMTMATGGIANVLYSG